MAITFESIGNGELAAQFKMALAQVRKNIMDPNMDPEAVREISINITFKPKKGGAIDSTYKVKPKLAGFQKSGTTFLIGQDSRTGRIEMSEYGNNRPQVAAYETVAAAPQSQEPVTPPQGFDPETGESYQARQGPIDLRRHAAGV